MLLPPSLFFFFNDTATTEIYTLSLHDALPISVYRAATPLQITQNDVRAIQLAKAALHAGVRLLMDHMGVDQVDRIRLAGAFGNHIDVKYATTLGMIPDGELSQVSPAGTAPGTRPR